MNINDYEHKKSGRGYKVKIICEYCNKEDWKPWNTILKGEGKFCSTKCANDAKFRDEVEGYEWRRGKSRHIEVKINCEICGKEKWVKLTRIREGRGKFCSIACANQAKADERPKHIGIENAGKSWDSSGNRFTAYWMDEDGTQHRTSYSKWLWEQNYGEVPEGYWVTYKDRNPENCELDNLELITRGERMSEALMGHKIPLETRKKISLGHTGKSEWVRFESHQGYPGLSKHLKQKIRNRDKNICRICGNDAVNLMGRVHHIDGNKKNQNRKNLILVCSECHGKIHSTCDMNDPVILAFRSMLKY